MRLRALGALLVFVTTLATGMPALASCTNASFDGTFAFSYGKTAGTETPTSVEGLVAPNGKGALIGKWVQSADGTISSATFTGTYTIGEDCAGTMVWNNSNHTANHFDIYLMNNNKGFQMLRTDAGHARAGAGSIQGATGCTTNGSPQNLVLDVSGTLAAEGTQKAVLGQIATNGHGGITGTATVSVNYNVTGSNLPVTGSYAVKSNCTGTAQIKIEGESAMNFDTIITNDGKGVMLFETDSGTLIAGTAQE
jgi:hypothetical protein